MARIEWVHFRLLNWARWEASLRGGGLGFSSQAAFLANEALREDPGARIPVDEVEAGITDRAVASLKVGHGHLYQTLRCYYLQGLGINGTATRMKRAVSTIHANLGQADAHLARWFTERTRAREARQDAAEPQVPRLTLLTEGERVQLLQQLREERARLEAREPVGPPRSLMPTIRRSRPVLTLRRGSFTS